MPEMTQTAIPTKAKHRKKNRESHNEVERHRKKKINSGINRVGDLIPCSAALKQSKNMILEQAYKYITELKRQNDELLLNAGDQEQAREIRKLRRELSDIQKENGRYVELLKSNDICLYDDPTLHWKGNAKRAKTSLIAPADQKLPLCLNSHQLASSNQGSAVHGITFNVGQSLQKQTANVVPVQRTCNLVTPMSISGVYPLDKAWQQNASTTSQQVSLCLPLTTSTPTTADLASSKGTQTVLFHTNSVAHLPLPSTSAGSQFFSSGQSAQPPTLTVSTVANIPSQPSLLASPVGMESPNSSHGKASEAAGCADAVKDLVKEIFPSVHIESSPEVVSSRDINPSVEVPTASASASCLETSWFLSNNLPELKSVGGITRIPSDGNTQTTWTTLQLAGNTVQPLSHSCPGAVPALLVEQAVASKDKVNQQMPACVSISSILASENRTGEPVMVQMPSGQPVAVQPFKTPTQPQSTTSILPLNQPVQVIQVAQPFNAALNTAPANQNIILLQPPAPNPCPPVPNPTVGQQIVIIQTAPNQNQIPLVSAQPSPSVVMPMNAAGPVVCPANPVQSIVAPQTFGAKHLVHILPRPAPVQPSVSTQVSASTAAANQQPPTISLNGQLFALQPVTPSAGSSSQAPMQIIQPTTSEDPNTNVALNTFGALATLSQSISQMGGQNCVQFTLNPSVTPSSLAANNQPVPRSSPTTATAETSAAPASVPTKSSSVKPVNGPAPNSKPKKNIKKPNVKKGGPLRRESTPTVTPDGPSEASKSQAHGDEQNQMEKLSVLVTAPNTAPEKTSEADGVPQNIDQAEDAACAEACASAALNVGMEGDILSEAVPHEHAPAEFSAARDFVAEEVCVQQNEESPPAVAPASPKVVAATLPLKEQPVQDSLHVGHPQDQSAVTGHEHSNSKDCPIQGEAADLTPVDLLEVQILSDHPTVKSLEKVITDVPDGSKTLYNEAESSDALAAAAADPVALTASVVHVAQNQPGPSEHEAVGSCANSRQTDSPMSNGRNFTVASMLPDTNRVDATNPVPSAPPFNGCSFSEQGEIAARAIFDQENLTKERARMQAEAEEAVSKNTEVVLSGDCCLPFKPHSAKEGISGLPSMSLSFSATESNAPSTHDRLMDKPHCTLGLNATNLPLQVASSQSQSVTSLSINNLIHQRGIMHSVANSASVSQASEHLHLATSTGSSMPSSSYEGHSAGTMVFSEYRQDELHAVKASAMQVPSNPDSLLKQSLEVRKEPTKRTAHGDELLSAAKRQKQCHGPMRIERIQQRDGAAEQNEMLVGQIPSDSSSLSGSIQGHGEGISSLFPASNNFVTPNLRQSDMRCNSQPSISEQSQMGNQHLQPLQQHQQAALLHNSNPYIKQQQTGHMRDQHHLYQQQQQQQHHHVQLADGSIHGQSRNVQQQRMIQQDVQMQKKRNSIQGAQVARLSLQQKQLPEQNRQNGAQAHSHHQQIQQQMPAHFGSTQAEKPCDNNTSARGLHSTHQQSHMGQDILHQHPQDINNRAQGSVVSAEHLPGLGPVQRLMTSRSLEQQLVSQPSAVSRTANMNMTTSHRQERNRVSSYSAEALIGKSTSNSEQRLGISVQASRISEQMEMRKYLDASRNKVMSAHNIQSRMTMEHSVNADSQRLADCQTFKPGSMNHQQQQPPPPASFEVPTSRNNNDGGTTANMRSLHSQTYRSNQNPNSAMERQKHLPYQTVQEAQVANTLPIRDHENSCHQSFMQSLLAPHLGEQVGANQRGISGPQRPQYNSSSGLEFGCPPTRDALHLRRDGDVHNRESCDLVMGQVTSRNNSLNIPFPSSSSSGDIQGRNTSPHNAVHKSHSIRQIDSQGAKNQLNIQVSINMHGVVHPPVPHQSVSHGNVDQRQTVRQVNPPVPQRSRHPLQGEADSKTRPPERNRSGSQRHSNMFDPTLPHLPLAGPSSMILGRQQPVPPEKRPGIVRFMPDASQVPTDNSGPDQHTLSQNFAFPFIPEGTMNPPINANASFMPPVTQATATRTSALIPVDPQNTLPSFYPPYSPAHPSLSNDLTLPYFSNQMFPNPSTEKTNGSGLNNRFGSILSPPRPVGFSQTTFPLLPEMPPMHMANPSHLSNFNLTSLFPEIATALPPDGSAMSPLLSISHPSSSDSSKQTSNRPAHNISHILGHDSSSAV